MGLLTKDEFSMLNVELRVPGNAPSLTSSANGTINERPMTYMAQQALKGEDGVNLEGYLDYRGTKVVGAWVWNEKLGFGLATEMGFDEAYVTVRTSRYIFVFFCLSLVIGFVAAMAITEQRRFRLQSEITTRKLKEQQLRDSIEKNKELMVSLNFQKSALDEHAIVSITDSKGNISYVNDKFCKVSGYSREELMGQNQPIVKSTGQSPSFYQDLWEIISSGKKWHGEIKNRSKDGGDYWIEMSILPFLNEQGEPYQFFTTIC